MPADGIVLALPAASTAGMRLSCPNRLFELGSAKPEDRRHGIAVAVSRVVAVSDAAACPVAKRCGVDCSVPGATRIVGDQCAVVVL